MKCIFQQKNTKSPIEQTNENPEPKITENNKDKKTKNKKTTKGVLYYAELVLLTYYSHHYTKQTKIQNPKP